MRLTMILMVLAMLAGPCGAEELWLRNSGRETIIIKFQSTSQRGVRMEEHKIPPSGNGRGTPLTIVGEDPYDVSFSVEPKSTPTATAQDFHAKVGSPIPLRELARDVGEFDVRLALAAKDDNGRQIYQATTAQLTNRNRNVNVFSKETNSDFVKQVLQRRWDTTYKAADGNSYGASIDFGRLTFTTSNFAGRFTELAVIEDQNECYIVGRWAALQSKGDVFFSITRQDSTSLSGEYTFDGDPGRYPWTGH